MAVDVGATTRSPDGAGQLSNRRLLVQSELSTIELDNMWVGVVVSFGGLSKGVRSHLVTVGFSRLLATSSCHLSGSPTQQLLH